MENKDPQITQLKYEIAKATDEIGMLEQEVAMWKNTAKVYEKRYEAMRNLAIANALLAPAIAVLILVVRLVK